MVTWDDVHGMTKHFAMVQLLRLCLKLQVLANARLMPSHGFYALCLVSSPGLLLSLAPTTITTEDDFRSRPTFPTSNASWAFPGESGQEIKFRLMLYIYLCNRASLDPNMLGLGQQEGVTFLLYTPALRHTREKKKKKQLQDRKAFFQLNPQSLQFQTKNLKQLLD